MRRCLTPLISAVFSILPLILTVHIEVQGHLLANLYTMMHNYCQEEQFPSPPPSMEQLEDEWSHYFLPVKGEVESIGLLSGGQGTKGPVGGIRPPSTGFGKFPGPRTPDTSDDRPEKPPRPIERPLPAKPPPSPTPSSSTRATTPSYSDSVSRRPSTPSTMSSGPYVPLIEYGHPRGDFSPMGQNTKSYFDSRERQPSSTATSPFVRELPGASTPPITKKPPPPKPKPKPKDLSGGLYATVQYDFEAQHEGDLNLWEGDRIRILRKSDSTDDWWEGELRGVKGFFPGNYVTL